MCIMETFDAMIEWVAYVDGLTTAASGIGTISRLAQVEFARVTERRKIAIDILIACRLCF